MSALLDAIPLANVTIVAIVGVLVSTGWRLVRRGHVQTHKRIMLTATALFVLFLLLYTTRLVLEGPTSFTEENPDAPAWAAPFYFAFLGVHMVLALVTTVAIPFVIRRALRGDLAAHKRLARKVAPMWLVSIAMGITVYFLLFVVFK